MVISYSYDGNRYIPRSETDKMKGFLIASIASGAILGTLPNFGKPFLNQLYKEHERNDLYKDAFEKALNKSGLAAKGVVVEAAQHSATNPSYRRGTNACYIPNMKVIRLNTDKALSAGFHEMGHAMNHLFCKSAKFLQQLRAPGYAIAGLMGYFAIFSRTKPKNAPKDLGDRIEDNCGKIAFAAMLPIVAEEALASYKGVKLAKQAGLSQAGINNLKKLYSKALLTYGGRAVLGGLAVGASRMIMDHYSRPKKVDNDMFGFLG